MLGNRDPSGKLAGMADRWAERTWPEHRVEGGAGPVVLVPVGSCEQHGPHLPLDTDTRVAVAVAEGAADRVAGRIGDTAVLVAPAVVYGASGEHQGFAGTVSIGTEALTTMLVELGRSLGDQCRLLVLVNGHGGNAAAVRTAVDRLRYEGRPVQAWSSGPAALGDVTSTGGPDRTDSHAGRIETSLLLALAPGLVRLDRAEAGTTEPLADLLPRMVAGGVGAVSANGVLGDPAGASAEEGAAILERLVEDLATMIVTAVGAVTEDRP